MSYKTIGGYPFRLKDHPAGQMIEILIPGAPLEMLKPDGVEALPDGTLDFSAPRNAERERLISRELVAAIHRTTRG